MRIEHGSRQLNLSGQNTKKQQFVPFWPNQTRNFGLCTSLRISMRPKFQRGLIFKLLPFTFLWLKFARFGKVERELLLTRLWLGDVLDKLTAATT